jgi:Ca2+-binding RTX toxin-like protein
MTRALSAPTLSRSGGIPSTHRRLSGHGFSACRRCVDDWEAGNMRVMTWTVGVFLVAGWAGLPREALSTRWPALHRSPPRTHMARRSCPVGTCSRHGRAAQPWYRRALASGASTSWPPSAALSLRQRAVRGPGSDYLVGDGGNDRLDGGAGFDQGQGGYRDGWVDWIDSLEHLIEDCLTYDEVRAYLVPR